MTTSEKILTYIKKHKRVKSEDIVNHIGLTDRAVYKALNKLVASGSLVRHGTPPKVHYSLGSRLTSETDTSRDLYVSETSQLTKLSEELSPVVNICLLIHKDGKFLVHESDGQLELPFISMKYYETISAAIEKIAKFQLKGLDFTPPHALNVVQTVSSDKSSAHVNICYLCSYTSGVVPNKKLYWIGRSAIATNKRFAIETKSILGEIYKYFDSTSPFFQSTFADKLSHTVMFNSFGHIILLKHKASFYDVSSRWDIAQSPNIRGHSNSQSANLASLNLYGVSPTLQFGRVGYKMTGTTAGEYYLYFGVSNGPYYINKEIYDEVHAFDCEKILKGYYAKSYDFTSEVYDYVVELKDVWKNLKEGGAF